MELEDLIKQHVSPLIENKNGWYATRCMVCNDHIPGSPVFKGFRGNFKLEGDTIGYYCYNCEHKAKYEAGSRSYSNNLLKVFQEFNIPEIEYNKLLLRSDGIIKPQEKSSLKVEPEEIKLLKSFIPLMEADTNNKTRIIAEEYLKSRSIDPSSYPFYISISDDRSVKKWKYRVIYPIYKDAKLVYYQGRDILGSAIRKYEGPAIEKQNVLYNYDAIMTYSKKPLFVVEGFFDAYGIDGVALIGKNITKAHIYWLNKTNRLKVIIPDREGDGDRIALQALKLGWSVTFPNFGKCKDVNAAIVKYGKLFVINEIMSNILDGKSAELKLKIYCK